MFQPRSLALVAVLSLLQALPTGWCCLLPVRGCSTSAAAASTGPVCKHCCQKQTTEPAAPADHPSAPPKGPQICCCVKVPTRAPEGPATVPPPAFLFTGVLPDGILPPAVHVGVRTPQELHVLRPCSILFCIWTC